MRTIRANIRGAQASPKGGTQKQWHWPSHSNPGCGWVHVHEMKRLADVKCSFPTATAKQAAALGLRLHDKLRLATELIDPPAVPNRAAFSESGCVAHHAQWEAWTGRGVAHHAH